MIPRKLQIAFAILVIGVAVLTVYLLRLRHRTAENVRRASDAQMVTPPGQMESVAVFLANDRQGVLRAAQLNVPVRLVITERAREILQALIAEYAKPQSSHILASGSGVSAVLLVNDKLAVVNLNSALAEGQPSGIGPETLTVASLVDTLSANLPGLEQVKFLVDGKQRETLAGHADLTRPFNVAAVQQAIPVVQ